MGKLAEIRNCAQERVFDLIREPDALYLSVKCSDSDKHSKVVRIKVSDVFYQIWKKMTGTEKREACRMIKNLIVADKKTA